MAKDRKEDHIQLAFESQTTNSTLMDQFCYEPLLSSHPSVESLKQNFLNYEFQMPLWISSMTGGTERAKNINFNLAKACRDFGIGMGLGSCRPLLESDERLVDFDLRDLIGEAPLYANFGIAQIEQLIFQNKLYKIFEITKRLQANGIVIHVNPLQEWAQAEGDRFKQTPLETIKYVCEQSPFPLIVKEVGQGMGPKSLKSLTELPLAAIELAGLGGTNFTQLELSRRSRALNDKNKPSESIAQVGHTPAQMIDWLNHFDTKLPIIISGGIKDPVEAHQLMLLYKGQSIVGMASQILQHALADYEQLANYLTELKSTFAIAKSYIQRK